MKKILCALGLHKKVEVDLKQGGCNFTGWLCSWCGHEEVECVHRIF